jgi:hypothetical protein
MVHTQAGIGCWLSALACRSRGSTWEFPRYWLIWNRLGPSGSRVVRKDPKPAWRVSAISQLASDGCWRRATRSASRVTARGSIRLHGSRFGASSVVAQLSNADHRSRSGLSQSDASIARIFRETPSCGTRAIVREREREREREDSNSGITLRRQIGVRECLHRLVSKKNASSATFSPAEASNSERTSRVFGSCQCCDETSE